MARHKVPKTQAQLNLTPMMDLIFQLIVFFLLVTNFSSSQLPELDPPDPDESQAREVRDRDRIIVNVLPDGGTGGARSVRVGLRTIEPGNYAELTRLLEVEMERAEARQTLDELEVDLRADGSIEYGNVQPIMNAITSAGIGRINLVAYLDRENGGPGAIGDVATPEVSDE